MVEAKAVETSKGVGRETDTTREKEAEAGSVTQTAQEIETGIVAATDQTGRKTEESTAARTGAGIGGIETIETTRETEIKAFNVAQTGTEIETGTVAATETGSTR
jgi:hypothetical protein